ncbi:iron complex transport system permease protein [Marininema mesophilum]|uniref:Iron complex transport system permease protein n=1 Tax=Marininema mesophilum TaxID=1048340 RepID=A0A1H2WER0_9BACL|nr:iron ABC transporter permease [Marininema mesophilum]SDW78966.1 iron complex transport system permease protein [Marininema mesophilum]
MPFLKRYRTVGLFMSLIALILSFIGSLKLGLTHINWMTLLDVWQATDPTREQLIVQNTRIPRALIATCVGASLGMAGALMQALTRNPLASPGVFGINAGAALFVVIASSIFSVYSYVSFTWFAFLGAAMSGGLVYLLGSFGRGGLTPLKLTLAGASLTAFFTTLTQGILVSDAGTMDQVLFWLAGSIAGRNLDTLIYVIPFFVIAWICTLSLGGAITTLTMGENVAKGLGQRTGWVKGIAAICIILLAGGSVAIAGPIGLVGLIIPHIARSIAGTDYRWILPYCALLGATFLLLADIGGRYLIMPGEPLTELLTGAGARITSDEVPVGVITALIGVPFFITIARRSISE